jgi:sulfur carrier protein
MQIVVNGEAREVRDRLSAGDLLAELELSPERVVVERNEAIIRRRDLALAILEPGDRVEIIQMIAGG